MFKRSTKGCSDIDIINVLVGLLCQNCVRVVNLKKKCLRLVFLFAMVSKEVSGILFFFFHRSLKFWYFHTLPVADESDDEMSVSAEQARESAGMSLNI